MSRPYYHTRYEAKHPGRAALRHMNCIIDRIAKEDSLPLASLAKRRAQRTKKATKAYLAQAWYEWCVVSAEYLLKDPSSVDFSVARNAAIDATFDAFCEAADYGDSSYDPEPIERSTTPEYSPTSPGYEYCLTPRLDIDSESSESS